MGRLIITADIHGSYSAWATIRKMLRTDDTLAVAGDLFDTIYQSVDKPDYQPDMILKEFSNLYCRKFYVLGNCDSSDYFQGNGTLKDFQFNGYSILLNHGHQRLPDLTDYDIIIEGHSHTPKLETLMGKIFMNPGSPVLPRNDFPSYATIENNIISIVNLYENTVVSRHNL